MEKTVQMNFVWLKEIGVGLFTSYAILFFIPAVLWSQSDSTILARIGTKEISVQDFEQRTELTIRPNNFKDKNTALNNLISEKILSLEAQQSSDLPKNPVFQATLKGIQEQSMRDLLRVEEGEKTVRLDTSEIKAAYQVSKREYDVEFYTLRDPALAERITNAFEMAPELSDDVFKELESMVGEKPVRTVKFSEADDDIIHDSLFSDLLDTGTVVGPLKLGSGSYIVMRVVNWVDHPLLSGEDQIERWNEVKINLRREKGRQAWGAYQAGVMKGKKIEFNRESFIQLSDLALKYYLRKKEADSLHVSLNEIPIASNEIALDAPFFTIDGKIWSVGEFQKELQSHPLVFRTIALDSSNFKREFKFAIVDMVRDRYLTQESYKKSLDASEEIHRTIEMWKDAFLAQDQEKRVIEKGVKEGKIKLDDRAGVRKYWLEYLQNIQQKYSNTIYINQDVLSKIKLTTIDMFVYRPGVPYPIAVPDFPLFISTQKLDSLLRKRQTL